MATHERPARVFWVLQIQYKRGGYWSDHTSDLFRRVDADALLAERRAAYPKLRYRLVRATTTFVVEAERPPATNRPSPPRHPN